PLYSQGPSVRSEAQEIRDRDDTRRRAWQELGLIILDPIDIDDDWFRQALINEAVKQYGRRRKA
ncbi:MAG: hypothetical protein MI867_11840, partial [Pseudomonadales bacterium]|nr:hypothetical protein [Pseudomonadales bacterium]